MFAAESEQPTGADFCQNALVYNINKREVKTYMKAIHQKIQTKLLYTLPLAALFVSAIMYSILKIPVESYATEKNDSATFSITDEPSLSIVLSSNSVNLPIRPTAVGQFGRTAMTVNVSTNNTTGYNLTMTADAISLSRSSAVNGETPEIPTLTSSVTCTDETVTTCDTFPTNYWGYKATNDTMTYLPVTTNATRINKTYAAANESITTVYLAAKLNNSIPTGTYDGVNLIFVATTNPVPYYMQEQTTSTLAALMPSVGNTVILADKRDQKEYRIVKMPDNNYWMGQNLMFEGNTMTADDTNISSVYTASNPLTITWYDIQADGKTSDGKCYGSEESGHGYDYACKMTAVAANSNGEITTWYNYAAASAMSVTGANNKSAAQYSICPKNWRLPISWMPESFNTYINAQQFAPIAGGARYPGGNTESNGNGYFWLNFASSSYGRYHNGIGGDKIFRGNFVRYLGEYVRCVFVGS